MKQIDNSQIKLFELAIIFQCVIQVKTKSYSLYKLVVDKNKMPCMRYIDKAFEAKLILIISKEWDILLIFQSEIHANEVQ